MKEIDFTTLSLQDALDLAVLIEKEAAERYQELADQLSMHHTEEAAEFFRLMVVNETRHGSELAERRKSLFGGAPSRVEQSMLWEVEAPEYEKVRVFMTVEDALNVALQSEEKAALFFSNAMPHLRDAGVRKLFEELHEEEIQHQKYVRNELARLPASKKVSVADNADEPVAQ